MASRSIARALLARPTPTRVLCPSPTRGLPRTSAIAYPRRRLSHQQHVPPSPSPPPKSPPYGPRQFLQDINLAYTLPISFVLALGLYAYIKSQLPEDQDGHSSQAIQSSLFSSDPLPALIELPKLDDAPVLDPSTQIPFPAELIVNTDSKTQEPLRLIGVGVRTVSFLAVKVYSAGFYADPSVLRALRVVPGWNTDVTKEKLLATNVTTTTTLPSSSPITDEEVRRKAITTGVVLEEQTISGENMMRNLLSAPVQFAIRIAPARSTDFTHLRDGFCRSLTARVSRATKQGVLTESEAERASESINTFRTFFPAGVSVPKGKSILLRKTLTDSLVIEYDGKTLGELKDGLIARELFLAYFADIDPISLKFKEAVAEGFEKLYH